jgi:hypothetical protein
MSEFYPFKLSLSCQFNYKTDVFDLLRLFKDQLIKISSFVIGRMWPAITLRWGKVTTTNFTSSKTKKNIKKFANPHYIKNGFLVYHYIEIDKDHYYENQKIEKNVKRTSKVSVLSDFHILTTYGGSTYGVFGFFGVNK